MREVESQCRKRGLRVPAVLHWRIDRDADGDRVFIAMRDRGTEEYRCMVDDEGDRIIRTHEAVSRIMAFLMLKEAAE